jgi:16S rRNA (uracil1498-N3)-methyltransferase
MKKNLHEAHQFALFYENLSTLLKNLAVGKSISLSDEEIVARIGKVLRLEPGQEIILFDRLMHAEVSITTITKKEVSGTLLTQQNNDVLQPVIHFMLPLLKREALQEALYSLAEMGVQEVHLVTTQKTQRDWQEKDAQRMQRIIIAAAEQSKNYSFPRIHEPVTLQTALEKIKNSAGYKLFFDPVGVPAPKYLPQLTAANVPLFLLIGPEGDLTAQEKELVAQAQFTFCALTPTILRASQAAGVSAALMRSWLNHPTHRE